MTAREQAIAAGVVRPGVRRDPDAPTPQRERDEATLRLDWIGTRAAGAEAAEKRGPQRKGVRSPSRS